PRTRRSARRPPPSSPSAPWRTGRATAAASRTPAARRARRRAAGAPAAPPAPRRTRRPPPAAYASASAAARGVAEQLGAALELARLVREHGERGGVDELAVADAAQPGVVERAAGRRLLGEPGVPVDPPDPQLAAVLDQQVEAGPQAGRLAGVR